MCDGYAGILNVFYCGFGKTMFSPLLEVTTIQDGGVLVKKVYRLKSFFLAAAILPLERPLSARNFFHPPEL